MRLRTRALHVVVIVPVLCVSAFAQGRTDWREWKYVAPLVVPAVSAPAFAAVVVSPEIAAKAAPDWSDLRLVDDRDVEQPYVLRVRRGGRTVAWRDARLLDPGFVATQYTQLVLDTGADVRVHNRLRLDIEAPRDFLTWLEVAVSADSRTWQVVRERAPIYSLKQAGLEAWLEASYPDSTSRYVRVRLLDGTRRFRVLTAAVAEEVDRTAELRAAPVTFASVVTKRPDRSVWETTPAMAGLGIAELRFSTTEPLFDRPILVESSDDGSQWRIVEAGQISRVQERAGISSSLVVRVHGPAAARWRITVYNRNDRPLDGLEIAAFETPRRVVFRQEPGRQYRLVYGRERTDPPGYDLARQVDESAFDAAIDGTIGRPLESADYRDPRPWTEQHPYLLWAAAALAILVLGGVALRTLRGP
jgi:hypothetical protein